MAAQAELADYLDEIRQEVCRYCPERPPGGPPCAPLGKNCGIELHLPQLVACTRQVNSGLIEPYLEHNRRAICTGCAFLHSDICPCPMDYLAILAVQAIEDVDERRAEWERLRTHLFDPARRPKVPVAEMCRAYEERTGTFTGCD
jgi:hypothetical protein